MPDRWPVGAAEIRNLLDQGELQMVEASPEHADLLQRQAEAHLLSARTLMADDPAGAFAPLRRSPQVDQCGPGAT